MVLKNLQKCAHLPLYYYPLILPMVKMIKKQKCGTTGLSKNHPLVIPHFFGTWPVLGQGGGGGGTYLQKRVGI